jgi:hypothetical protein
MVVRMSGLVAVHLLRLPMRTGGGATVDRRGVVNHKNNLEDVMDVLNFLSLDGANAASMPLRNQKKHQKMDNDDVPGLVCSFVGTAAGLVLAEF